VNRYITILTDDNQIVASIDTQGEDQILANGFKIVTDDYEPILDGDDLSYLYPNR